MSDEALDDIVKSIKEQHPAVGEKMMRGHLAAKGIHVQRSRMRLSLQRVDSEGIAVRRLFTVQRRRYSVPAPNYLWHIDGTHKLIRWKLVVHAGIDGYSRLITYCHCSSNNQASTVLSLFSKAVETYGLPLKVRSDYGGENVLVWNFMLEKHLNSNCVLTGRSVHNQRIERLNRDINTQVLNYYVNFFSYMEENQLLDPENTTDLFVLHFVFMPIINKKLSEFKEAFNNHPLSTAGCLTPKQLHNLNLRLLQLQQLDPSGAITSEEICYTTVNRVEVITPLNPLCFSELQALQTLILNNSDKNEIALFKMASVYVGECLTTRGQ